MKTMDIVKEPPKTQLEDFERWMNNTISKMTTDFHVGKKIEVKYIEKLDDKLCPPSSRGRVICERNGEHSWFSHAMDGAY